MFHVEKITGIETVRKYLESLRKAKMLGTWNVVFLAGDIYMLIWEEVET